MTTTKLRSGEFENDDKMAKKSLTGIKPTGAAHLGNYVGAIKPALALADEKDADAYYFIADYHALTTRPERDKIRHEINEIAATWLAFGLNPEEVYFYRQAHIPEILELHWMLTCFTAKGLMNRAHAYKALIQDKKDDSGVPLGIYTYPVLMAADILMFDADVVPVGQDQLQHIEITRDIATAMNAHYGEQLLKLPTPSVHKEAAIIPGLDGQKMSKSYNNTIPCFLEPAALKKLVMKIKTDSTLPDEPKNPDESSLFLLYKHFASDEEISSMRERYQTGIGWGDVKKTLAACLEENLAKSREIYLKWMNDEEGLDKVLKAGAAKIRPQAQEKIEFLRQKIGV